MDAQVMRDMMSSQARRDLLMAPMAPMLSRAINDMAPCGTTTTVSTPPPNIADIDNVYEQIKRVTLEVEATTWASPGAPIEPIEPPQYTTKTVRPIWSNGYSCVGYKPDRLVKSVKTVARALPRFMDECEADAIAVRGSSGVLFAGMLMMHLPKLRVLICRKDGEASHSDQINVTGGRSLRVKAYVFVDDFISSGNTLDGVEKDLAAYGAECTGICSYQATDRPMTQLRPRGKVKGRPHLSWDS